MVSVWSKKPEVEVTPEMINVEPVAEIDWEFVTYSV